MKMWKYVYEKLRKYTYHLPFRLNELLFKECQRSDNTLNLLFYGHDIIVQISYGQLSNNNL